MVYKENVMPWYAWLILIIALGSIVGGLMLLRDTAKKLPLTEEQLKKIHERNAEADAKDAQDR
jgi:hypothetical protein